MDSNLQELRPQVVDSVKSTCYLDVFSCKHAFSVKKVPQEQVQLKSPASVTVHYPIVDANASYMRSHHPLTWTRCTCSVKTQKSWVIWAALACQVAFAHERHLALLVSGAGKRESQVGFMRLGMVVVPFNTSRVSVELVPSSVEGIISGNLEAKPLPPMQLPCLVGGLVLDGLWIGRLIVDASAGHLNLTTLAGCHQIW